MKAVLNSLHLYACDAILQAQERSRLSRKPILLLIGENHLDPVGTLYIATLIAAAYTSGIRRFCVESNAVTGGHTNAFLSQYNESDLSQHTLIHPISKDEISIFNPSIFTQFLFEKLNVIPEPVDCGVGNALSLVSFGRHSAPDRKYSPISKHGIVYRNRVMSDLIASQQFSATFMITGSYHLHGFVKETELSNHFEIVQFNASNWETHTIDVQTPLEDRLYISLCYEHLKSLMNLHRIFSLQSKMANFNFSKPNALQLLTYFTSLSQWPLELRPGLFFQQRQHKLGPSLLPIETSQKTATEAPKEPISILTIDSQYNQNRL